MGGEHSIHGIGLTSVRSEEHTEFLMDGGKRGEVISGVMASTARDAWGSPAHTPSTTLRKGLVLGRIAASQKLAEYHDAHIDGTGVAMGILMDTINLLDANATPADAACRVHVMGWYDEDKLYGLDANGITDLKALGVLFKNDVLPT